MDPVSAFSLAGTVVQFIDFGSKFVHLAWTIYHTNDELPSEVTELMQLTETFENVSSNITSTLSPAHGSEYQDGLNDLAKDCMDFSKDLAKRLCQAGFLSTTPETKRGVLNMDFSKDLTKRLRQAGFSIARPETKGDVLKTAIRRMLSSRELNILKKRLDTLRGRFNLQLLASLRHFAVQNQSRQDEILQSLSLSTHENSALHGKVEAILEKVSRSAIATSGLEMQTQLRHDIMQRIYKEKHIASIGNAVSIDSKAQSNMQKVILATLRYHDPAQEWSNLPRWLESSDQIYWVTGKAGSGKSTLMKFLSHPLPISPSKETPATNLPTSRCQPFLGNWAQERKLMVVPFYFWASSPSKLQASYDALLRTLLYRILSVRPSIIPDVMPARWEALSLLGSDPMLEKWSDTELKIYLFAAVQTVISLDCCICFFIDGLDEFDGDPNDLIKLVRGLATIDKNIKLCIASRPWVQFQEEFAIQPHLMLEKLTYRDIKDFVSERFRSNVEFSKLRNREETYADELIEMILSMASGVFLWVQLVVASLLAGMHYGDRIEDLQRRLEQLPRDLESLYDRMLEDLDPFYQEHAAQMIALMEASIERPSLMMFTFADKENTASLERLPNVAMTTTFRDEQLDATRRRINSRLKGMIEVAESATPSGRTELIVEYHHKTVKDFIHGKRFQDFLKRSLDPAFDPHLQLCIGYCACLKTCAFDSDAERIGRLCVQHAKLVSIHKQAEMIRVVDGLSNVYASKALRTTSSTSNRPLNSFMIIAISESLTNYFSVKLDGGTTLESLNDLLYMAVDSGLSPKLHLDMIRLLLDRGADSNPVKSVLTQRMYEEVFRYGEDILHDEIMSRIIELEEQVDRKSRPQLPIENPVSRMFKYIVNIVQGISSVQDEVV